MKRENIDSFAGTPAKESVLPSIIIKGESLMYAETKHEWGMDRTLSAEVMRPLEERIAEEKPALSGCLAKLRELLPKEVFDRSFAKVENLSKSGEALLIVTNAMHRSFIERDCIGALKEAFGVKYVRVVG